MIQKNCCGTGRVDGWTWKVLQEVLADLKSIFAKIAWFAKDLFTSGSSDLRKCFWNMSGLRRKTVCPVCLRPFCFVLLCSQIGNWEGGSGAGLFTGRLLLSAQQHPTSSHSVRQRLAGPFPPSATSGTRRRVNPSEGVERNSSHVPPVTIEPNQCEK